MSFLVFFTSALTVCVSPCLQPSRCQSLAHVVLFRLCMSCLASATSDLCMHHPCCVCLSVLRVCPVYLLFCTSASCMSNFSSGTQGLYCYMSTTNHCVHTYMLVSFLFSSNQSDLHVIKLVSTPIGVTACRAYVTQANPRNSVLA